ncbi:MAG: carboxymuconolactone decarboxylase family protein [Deltaproteobacteria bacterium]|nr:carboxymuconolactone decarboxylase family protein [Deltaproteobacteria bacterium]
MPGKLAAFHEFRSRMNEKLLSKGNLQLKRFFNLDSQAYVDGALPSRTKELMGLVASAVLRCDDCITYHMIQCAEAGVSDEEFFETFNVILVVGGSITIPHIRRAVETLEELRASQSEDKGAARAATEEKGKKTRKGKGRREK